MIKLGDLDFTSIKQGSTDIIAVYLADEMIWGGSQPSVGGVVTLTLTGGTTSSVTYSDGIVPNSAFTGNLDIVALDIGSGIKKINSTAFAQCSNISSVTIADTVTRLGGYIFSGCTALTSVYIPDSVNEIAGGTFYRCSGLTEVTIGSGLTRFSNPFAFYYCTSLSSITCYATTAPILSGAGGTFSHLPSVGTLTVPYGSDYSSWVGTGATSNDTLASGWTIQYMGGYSQEYLTFVALEDNMSVGLTNGGTNVFQYSVDSGSTWSNIANSQSTTSVNSGQTIMFKASNPTVNSRYGIGYFKPSASASVEGNVMSLIYGDDFADQTNLIGKNNAFKSLFNGNTNLISAENLVLPATTLATNCYSQMFKGCTSLTTAPELPATTLASNCYQYMFKGCTSLTTAPELKATTLASSCYSQMFDGCTSLTTAPELKATTLASSCYSQMFQGCRNLTTAPELPSTTLASYCYKGMFVGCTSLTTAPELPATTLASNCYNQMFSGCTSLTTAPSVLPSTTLVSDCYMEMFFGCTSLNSITCLATNISAINCTSVWVYGVASNGTFTKAASMTRWSSGVNGIPNGWTVVNDGASDTKYSVTVNMTGDATNDYLPDSEGYSEGESVYLDNPGHTSGGEYTVTTSPTIADFVFDDMTGDISFTMPSSDVTIDINVQMD